MFKIKIKIKLAEYTIFNLNKILATYSAGGVKQSYISVNGHPSKGQ